LTFQRMYYEAVDNTFTREEYYRNIRQLRFQQTLTKIEGSMSSGHKCLATVAVYPVEWKDFAVPILKQVLKHEKCLRDLEALGLREDDIRKYLDHQ